LARPPEFRRVIELRTLGTLELTSADGTPLAAVLAQPRRTALLCYLALASPRGFQRRDTLLALFWPEHDAERARRALRQSLYFLRRALGATALVSRGDDDLALAPDHVRCDAAEFERAAHEGRLDDALALYRGDLLVGFHIADVPQFERWLDEERSRLRRRAAEAAWALAGARERSGDASGAAEWGQRAAEFSPGDETVLRRLVLLLNRLGDRAAAVRAYEAFARELEREYELEPSEATRALLARIRAKREGAVETVPGSAGEPQVAPPERGSRVALQPDLPAEAPAAGADAPQPLGGSGNHAHPTRVVESPRVPALASRRRWRPMSAGAASAALLALLGVGAWRLAARAHSEPAPSVRERVIVSDFTNGTSDSTYGDLVAHVLRSELARSPLLIVVGRGTIADALQRMRAEPGRRLDDDLAREVAVREGVKVVIEGDVRTVGTAVAVSASVIDAANGDVIHGATETARDSTEVLAAVERLSDGIRRGIGESLASIKATNRYWSFTTSSLAALRKQVAEIEAWRRGDNLRGVELSEEAIALDPDFAHAYVSLAGELDYAGLPRGRAVPGLVRAYGFRDHLTERERYAIEGHYHLNVTGDLPKALSAFRKLLETPQCMNGEPCWQTVAGGALELSGDLEAAEQFLGERHARSCQNCRVIRVRVLYALGRHVDAHRLLDELSRRTPEHPGVLRLQVGLLADSGRYEEAHALAARVQRNSSLRNDLQAQAALDAVRGRYDEAIQHLRDLRNQALGLNERAPALEIAAAAGRLHLLSGDPAGASEVDELLAHGLMDSLDVLSRPYLPLVLLYAEANQSRQAQTWLDAYEREFPPEFRGPDGWMLHRARAAVHRAAGRPEHALRELRQATRVPALRVGLFDEPSIRTSDHPELARVYEALGEADSAIAVYERYLGVRSLNRMATDAFELARALQRLGILYEWRGDRARAAAHFRRAAELWRTADAPLQARAEAARRRAAALNPPPARAP
jgi:DNA-binding SARP family transcriptional activator/TolB-like protein